ncbi:hypothetical protein NQ314_004732 [Rhamnusium bicolor]|uniref:Uncharacterized protein n=1 Tax=Rhamnusium bicolor TaxID=1586634 RepID=A0AAV8ZJT4_9CUCU|nr:hypothetical protein NQ314_004732 [Rhamnusium bicolor]
MKGVTTIGKVVYFTATFPFFILFVLLVRGLTLPGAWDGVYFYIFPQWDQLTNLKVWADAAIQIFFSLGPGWGGIVNMASYNDFRCNSKLISLLVPIINCGTSIFAGFVVFSVIGFMAHETGLPVSTVATGGPGLAFFVNIESLINSIVDEYPGLRNKKPLMTLLSIVVMMLVSIIYTTNGGMYWVQLFDWYAASVSVVLICLVEVFIVGWTYGVKNFIQDIEFMLQVKISWFWRISWQFSTPIILTFIFVTVIAFNRRITYQGVAYPDWAVDFGWYSCSLSMICIPLYMPYRLLYLEKGDLVDRIKSSIQPRRDWGPAKKEDRILWANEILRKIAGEEEPEEVDPQHEQFIQLCVTSTQN